MTESEEVQTLIRWDMPSIIGIIIQRKFFNCATSLTLKFSSVKHLFLGFPFRELEGQKRTFDE